MHIYIHISHFLLPVYMYLFTRTFIYFYVVNILTLCWRTLYILSLHGANKCKTLKLHENTQFTHTHTHSSWKYEIFYNCTQQNQSCSYEYTSVMQKWNISALKYELSWAESNIRVHIEKRLCDFSSIHCWLFQANFYLLLDFAHITKIKCYTNRCIYRHTFTNAKCICEYAHRKSTSCRENPITCWFVRQFSTENLWRMYSYEKFV